MRILLIGMLAVMVSVLFAGPATAAKLLLQNVDGTACWFNNVDGTCVPTGEHTFVVEFDDLTTAATRFIVIPFAGRLKSASVVIDGEIVTATEIIEFRISKPASLGGFFNRSVAVTPEIAEAATGLYELVLGLSYAGSGQHAWMNFPANSNTSLDFDAYDIIIIHTLGLSTPAATANNNGTVTIIVH